MHEQGHYPNPYLPEIPPWLVKWFEDQNNPYPRDGSYNYYDPYAGQQVGSLEVPFNKVASYLAQKNGMGAETPNRTYGRQVGAAEYPSGQMLNFPSWMEGPPGQMSGRNYAQLLMSYINQGRTDSPPNPFSELKSNPLMAELLAAKAGRGSNPYDPEPIFVDPNIGVKGKRPKLPDPPPYSPKLPPPPPRFPRPSPEPKPDLPLQPLPKPSQPKPSQPKPSQPKPSQLKPFLKPTLNSFIPRYERD